MRLTIASSDWYDYHMYRITIKEGKEKLPMKHHPWIFSGAISRIEPRFAAGDWADVFTSDGRFIAHGWYDEKSHIILHLLSWDEDETMSGKFVQKLAETSIARRDGMLDEDGTNALRLIHGEADFLPGVAVDIYAGIARIVISSRFGDHFLQDIVRAVQEEIDPERIEAVVDRSYASAENLKAYRRIFINGEETEKDEGFADHLFLEDHILYSLEQGNVQKSGFYCDQRENRKIAEGYAEGRNVLDLFSYTGGFTLHVLRGGCKSVKAVDSSESALQALMEQVKLNENHGNIPKGSSDRLSAETADCFEYIRSINENEYDMIILDPPKLAKTKSALENALRAYKDLNRVAMMKIRDGGIIFTFSCSGAVSREDFRMMLGWAAKDAGAEVQILNTLSAGPDHPIRLSFPESEYLKGYAIRVLK